MAQERVYAVARLQMLQRRRCSVASHEANARKQLPFRIKTGTVGLFRAKAGYCRGEKSLRLLFRISQKI
jgi:hypothetical protein